MIVSMSVGGSTNVMLHAPEIARAAGFKSFADDIMTPEEFNHLSEHIVPVLIDADQPGITQWSISTRKAVLKSLSELLDAGLLNGDTMTCTGETLAEDCQTGSTGTRWYGDFDLIPTTNRWLTRPRRKSFA